MISILTRTSLLALAKSVYYGSVRKVGAPRVARVGRWPFYPGTAFLSMTVALQCCRALLCWLSCVVLLSCKANFLLIFWNQRYCLVCRLQFTTMLLDFYCYYLSGAQIKFPGSPDSLHGCNRSAGSTGHIKVGLVYERRSICVCRFLLS